MTDEHPLLGYVVLTNFRKDGDVKWEPDWDGEVHVDRARADKELSDCASSGHDCTLAEVRQVSERFTLSQFDEGVERT